MSFVIALMLFGAIITLQAKKNLEPNLSIIQENLQNDFKNEKSRINESLGVNLLSKYSKMYGKKSFLKDKKIFPTKRLKRDNSNELRKEDYDKAINETIADYYAQRKAVMDRYYARQKEISEKFGKKSAIPRQSYHQSNLQNETSSLATTTTTTTTIPTTNPISNIIFRAARDQDYLYSTTEESYDPFEITEDNKPGYHEIGRRTGEKNEKLLYQHNLGIGLKGKSDLDAAFEVILDESFSITYIELTPYNANSTASMEVLKGGINNHFVKIKLQPQQNRGLSYIIKVWGIKK